MAEELANGGEQAWSRMSGYPSGRSVLTECMVERFSRSPHEWEDAFKNRDKRAEMLTEILAVESSSSKADKARGSKGGAAPRSASASSNGAANGNGLAAGLAPSPFNKDSAEGGDEGGKGKEKRRRQRGRGKRGKSGAAGEAAAAAADAEAGGQENGDEGIDEDASPSVDGSKATMGKGTKKSGKPRKEEAIEMDAGETRPTGGETGAAAAVSAKKERKGSKKGKSESVAEQESEEGGQAGAITEEVPKKKKRRRQENGSKPDQGSGGGDGNPPADATAETDLSFVMDAIKASASGTDGRAQPASTGDKKPKKKKRGIPVDGGGGHGEEGTAHKAVVSIAGDGRGDGGDGKEKEPLGKKKKKSKKTKKESEKAVAATAVEVPAKKGSIWDAMETPSTRKVAAVDEEPNEPSSSGKKRKSGFRLF